MASHLAEQQIVVLHCRWCCTGNTGLVASPQKAWVTSPILTVTEAAIRSPEPVKA